MNFIIEFYQDKNGNFPAKDFIRSLEPKLQARIIRILDLLGKNGTSVKMPYSRHLQDGIFEIRANQGNNAARILYFFMAGQTIILTNGFIKKVQKTPQKQIELARKYRADYMRRNEK